MNEELSQTPENTDQTNISEETAMSNSADVEATENAVADQPRQTEINDVENHEILDEQVDNSELEASIATLNRNDVVERLSEIVKHNLADAKTEIALLKVHFQDLAQTRKTELEQAFEPSEEQSKFEYIKDELDEKFAGLIQFIREEKQRLKEEDERIRQENLKLKLAVLNELRQLIDSEESLKTTYDEFKKLQETWKEIGAIPKNESNNLWQNYHFLIEKFFDKVKINKDLRDLDLKKNLEAKIELCEKAEELLLESSIIKSFKSLQEYHEKWKEIGPVPMDKKDEIWERFKTTSDTINQKRRDFYETQQAQAEQNYLAKQALFERTCELLERPLESINQWNKANDEINEILNLWKQIGRAAVSKNEVIWAKFKELLNAFFERKRLFFSQIKDVQIENLNRKIELCIQAEALALRDDYKIATNEIIALQNEWKTIGPTAKKHTEKIWHRFRAACDAYFSKKNSFYSESRLQEKENLKLKEELILEIKSAKFDTFEKEDQLQHLKDFQKRWTHIGHVPFREKDRLQEEFRQSINALMQNMNILPGELHASTFAGRYTKIQKPEDADGLSHKDIMALQSKIVKQREEILLWENNLGFLGKSKNADALRREMDAKILRAKQELALLEAKMKIIRQR